MPRGVDCNLTATLLDERGQILDLSLAHKLIKSTDGKLLEMWGAAMELARSPVQVLLVDNDPVGVMLDGVWDVADATRLLAGREGQLTQNVAYMFAVFRGEPHTYDKADHCASNLSDQLECIQSSAA